MTQPDARCPTCGPTTSEQHPRLPVSRCTNCKEHLPSRDLLAWLETAITERETAAREACDGGEGRWHNGWCPDGELEEGETDSGCGVSDERDRTVVYDEGRPNKAQSVHIALNDPASVLRRCAADRKLIAEHGPFSDRDSACKGCGLDMIEELITSYYQDCPVLVAIAEGYGWTEG